MSLKCVYRAYDKGGELLYVGCSIDIKTRIMAHKRTSEWHNYMDRISLRFYHSNVIASLEERHAIRTENPKFNIKCRRPDTLSDDEIEDYNIKRRLAVAGNNCIKILKGILLDKMNGEPSSINRPGVGWSTRFKYIRYCDLTSDQSSIICRFINSGGNV